QPANDRRRHVVPGERWNAAADAVPEEEDDTAERDGVDQIEVEHVRFGRSQILLAGVLDGQRYGRYRSGYGVPSRSRPLRLDDGGGRLDDRIGHLHRLGGDVAPDRQPGL